MIGILTANCSFADAPHNLNLSFLFNPKCIPIGHGSHGSFSKSRTGTAGHYLAWLKLSYGIVNVCKCGKYFYPCMAFPIGQCCFKPRLFHCSHRKTRCRRLLLFRHFQAWHRDGLRPGLGHCLAPSDSTLLAVAEAQVSVSWQGLPSSLRDFGWHPR